MERIPGHSESLPRFRVVQESERLSRFGPGEP
ncbi:hypothetical protein FHR32_006930 [Streptosporangium album]|uniref:Uncharacterized protein n=1 Tax=Streptosporangium album TaxID=47479 RepID=A0A7W7S260_9ACTN|nr:hypothetical protein [Streptosporangium album]